MNTKKYCLTLDLKDDHKLIEEYEVHHRNVWPETQKSFSDAGILSMEIFRWHNRLFMILVTSDDFSFERKRELDLSNVKVQEWETLMESYQQRLPGSLSGEKWQLMSNIYTWSNNDKG